MRNCYPSGVVGLSGGEHHRAALSAQIMSLLQRAFSGTLCYRGQKATVLAQSFLCLPLFSLFSDVLLHSDVLLVYS